MDWRSIFYCLRIRRACNQFPLLLRPSRRIAGGACSGDFTVRVREQILAGGYDCIAVPLPESFKLDVLAAVEQCPRCRRWCNWPVTKQDTCTNVPIDPCQPVIAALRCARRERIAVEFVDLESAGFDAPSAALPDPYAIKQTKVEQFLAALLPAIPRPQLTVGTKRGCDGKRLKLHRLELDYKRTLYLPWISIGPGCARRTSNGASIHRTSSISRRFRTARSPSRRWRSFWESCRNITALYENSRLTLDGDDNLSIDGVKQLVLEAATAGPGSAKGRDNWLSPKLLQIFFQYARNLTLLGRRLSPDLYTLVMAAKQIGGDGFALAVLETAKDYRWLAAATTFEELRMGIGQIDLPTPSGERQSRLPTPACGWRSLKLRPEPPKRRSKLWSMMWDPYKPVLVADRRRTDREFSYPCARPGKALIGQDLARSEKFTTSVKDGLDIRETLRNWHTGDLYVRVCRRRAAGIEVVVFLFDVPADPDKLRGERPGTPSMVKNRRLAIIATDIGPTW